MCLKMPCRTASKDLKILITVTKFQSFQILTSTFFHRKIIDTVENHKSLETVPEAIKIATFGKRSEEQ